MNFYNSNNPYGGLPMDPYMSQQQFVQPINSPMMTQQQQQYASKYANVDPRIFDTPTITMGDSHKPLFTIGDKANNITVDNMSDVEMEKDKKKRSGVPADKKEKVSNQQIIKVDAPESVSGEVIDSTMYTYQETNHLLHETLGQIDAVNAELVQEFNSIRNNRTMKNKYNVLNALSENIGSMINNRISTIKEINNCITKSNDMDYKKYKDIQAAQSAMNDDKYIADLYQSFIKNPQNVAPTYQTPNIDPSIMGSGIIRANVPNSVIGGNSNIIDEGYLNYVANMTPEQNLMRYESDPNVKQVVVYDASTGAKFFQMMNMATGEAIPGLPTYDNLIMEDTTLDLANGIAKNLNLRENFPIVQINNNITSQY